MWRVSPASTGFVFHSQTRPLTPTESSSPVSVRRDLVTDWPFSPRCSPPRITATQLRFDTARLFTAQKRTPTVLSPRLLRRTSADLQSALGARPIVMNALEPDRSASCQTLAASRSQTGAPAQPGACDLPFHFSRITLHIGWVAFAPPGPPAEKFPNNLKIIIDARP
jgi:hypothetical protein